MLDRFTRLRYPVQHAILSTGISTLAGFICFAFGWPLAFGVVVGPAFYILRELNQFAAGRLSWWPSWPESWVIVLGRPNPKFDGPGLLGGLAPLLALPVFA